MINRACHAVVPAVVLGAALAPVACGGTEPQPQTVPGLKAFVGARVIDGTGNVIEAGTLVVRDGRFEAAGSSAEVTVPDGAERIDVSGKTIMPGMVNAHGHVNDTRGLETKPEYYTTEHVLHQLNTYARYGVTTVFSLGGDREAGFEQRGARETPGLDRARLYVAGTVVAADEPDAGRAMVDKVADMNPDIVKIRVDDNLGTTKKMPEAVYRAVIQRAHERGLRVAAHVFYLDDAKGLVEAGADLLAHSVRDRDADDELIRLLKARDVCLCPTLMREVSTFVYEETPSFFDDPFFQIAADPQVLAALKEPARQKSVQQSKSAQAYKAALEVASRNVKALADAGVTIASGTDTGPAGRFQGYFEHLELERLVGAGLSPMQALVAATGDAARCLRVDDRIGTIRPGRWADFLVLGANPLVDVRNTRTLESVWIAGNRLGAPGGS